MTQNQVYLSLGSNIPDKLYYLQKGIESLSKQAGIIEKVSSVYETEPWGFFAQESFYNIALYLNTTLNPSDLLARCQSIESVLGRKREQNGYNSRTLDIDILFFNHQIIKIPDLCIPHPLIQERKFVLVPLAEIAPDFVHPSLHTSLTILYKQCKDTLEVKKINKSVYSVSNKIN